MNKLRRTCISAVKRLLRASAALLMLLKSTVPRLAGGKGGSTHSSPPGQGLTLTCELVDSGIFRHVGESDDALRKVTGRFVHFYERVRPHVSTGIVSYVDSIAARTLEARYTTNTLVLQPETFWQRETKRHKSTFKS